jgi:two-component system sensor histidine kinase YesM
VENAIVHGFRNSQEKYLLEIIFREEDGRLKIRIADNGTGFDTSVVERIMRGEPAPTEEKGHIGLENAILRFDMYTDGRGTLRIDSHPGEGTTVEMEFPEVSI